MSHRKNLKSTVGGGGVRGGKEEGAIMNSPKASQKSLRHHHQEPDWHTDWHSNWRASLRSPEQGNLFAGDLSGEATRQPTTRVPCAVTLFDPRNATWGTGSQETISKEKRKGQHGTHGGKRSTVSQAPPGGGGAIPANLGPSVRTMEDRQPGRFRNSSHGVPEAGSDQMRSRTRPSGGAQRGNHPGK